MATITAPLPYSYQALPARRWFRVLNLHPGSLDSPISCELVSTPLISAPTYKALSYVWGDPSNKITITCSQRTIQVTRSLHEALRHLRHANEPITIWADAICINQSDMSEKGHQVDMMGDIYERAGEVLVWFGNEHADRAALAFRSLEAINTKITTGTDRESFNPDRPNPALEYVEPRLASAAVLVTATRSTLPSIITEDCKAAITRLYTMPWFTRVWVLQEVGLAARATAFWGDESIEFSHIAEFIQHARIHSDLRGNLGQEILGLLAGPPDHALWNVWSTYDRQGSWLLRTPALREFSEALASQTKIDFVLVLEASRLFGATNDLDHVYAFLGHPKAKLAGRNEPLVQANYSIGVDELHLLVASRLALESFNFLAQVQVTADSLLPGTSNASWIPKWNINVPNSPSAYWEAWDASRRLAKPSPYRCDVTGQRLGVTASLIDSVAEQTEIMSPKDFEEGQPGPGNLVATCWDLATKGNQPPCHGPRSYETFAATLACHYRNRSTPAEAEAELLVEQFVWFCAVANPNFHVAKIMRKDKLFPSGWTTDPHLLFGRMFEHHATHRRFFVTRTGMWGMGPALMEPGDVCAVIHGADVPFVLRPTANAEEYKLVGQCYIAGCMYGEVLEMRQDEESGPRTKEVTLI